MVEVVSLLVSFDVVFWLAVLYESLLVVVDVLLTVLGMKLEGEDAFVLRNN